jgi:hypothetical protein
LDQHIKEIFLVENGGQRNSQEENKKNLSFHKKFPALWSRASKSGHFSSNLWFRICNMGFVQHIQVKILPENLSQNKAKEGN